jgi:hypothetical protein
MCKPLLNFLFFLFPKDSVAHFINIYFNVSHSILIFKLIDETETLFYFALV